MVLTKENCFTIATFNNFAIRKVAIKGVIDLANTSAKL